MAKDSNIEWTHHTFNPWLGCVEVSPACDHCYARTLVTGRMARDVWGKDKPRPETSESYWHQPFVWDRAAERAGERHRVFCGSLCDVMEDRRDLDRIRGDLYKLIESTPHLDWLLLTKRPQNFGRFLPSAWLEKPLSNVWGMTTVESAEYLWRVTELLNTPFAVRMLSCEPLLGPLDLTSIPCMGQPSITRNVLTGRFHNVPFVAKDGARVMVSVDTKPRIDGVICGGESGARDLPIRAMNPDWARSLRDQCVAAGTAFFHKQNGEYASVSEVEGPGEHFKFPDGTTVRRVGKKRAGRLLDGREWNELPGVRP
jgi:protein gp37